MPATIVQTNSQPFAPAEIDPVTLDIIENALRNARVEMDATLVRTAMSPGIREQGDAFPLIADHNGKMIVGQFGSFTGGLDLSDPVFTALSGRDAFLPFLIHRDTIAPVRAVTGR